MSSSCDAKTNKNRDKKQEIYQEEILKSALYPEIVEHLTPSELYVLWNVIQGLENKLIAQNLFISTSTVKFHLESLYSKTNSKNRTELTQKIFLALINCSINFEVFAKKLAPEYFK